MCVLVPRAIFTIISELFSSVCVSHLLHHHLGAVRGVCHQYMAIFFTVISELFTSRVCLPVLWWCALMDHLARTQIVFGGQRIKPQDSPSPLKIAQQSNTIFPQTLLFGERFTGASCNSLDLSMRLASLHVNPRQCLFHQGVFAWTLTETFEGKLAKVFDTQLPKFWDGRHARHEILQTVVWNQTVLSQQTMGSKCAWTIDVTHWTQAHSIQQRLESPTITTWHAINTRYINSTSVKSLQIWHCSGVLERAFGGDLRLCHTTAFSISCLHAVWFHLCSVSYWIIVPRCWGSLRMT